MAITKVVEEVLNTPGQEVSGEIFVNNPDAAFWLGEVAAHGIVTSREYYDELTRFRADTYVKLGFMEPSQIDYKGRDIDHNESRSTNLIILKHEDHVDRETTRVEGSGRIIYKLDPEKQLPIEELFSELFVDEPLPPDAAEVSRFIARDSDEITRHMISLSMIRAITHTSVESNVGALYCVIEKPLLKLLQYIGIPLVVMGESKDIPSEGGVLYPVHIFADQILDSVKTDKMGILDLKRFFNEDPQRGLGFYALDFMLDSGVNL